jgi:tetratricopeptide (TPR) repeat protein
MKSDAIAFGVAGMLFGLIAGWIIGSEQAKLQPSQPQPAARQSSAAPAPSARILDENQVAAFKAIADREASNPVPRTQLGNLYFDAERYDEAIKWYAEALKLAPKDVNISTDLGISYYYTNQPDKALQQFDRSLALDPKHVKTLWNVGVVKAFGKQDLEGAQVAWQQVVQLAPESDEGQQAKMALERLRSAHPPGGTGRGQGS